MKKINFIIILCGDYMLLASCNRDSLSENSLQNTNAENSAKGIVTNLTEQDLQNIQLTGEQCRSFPTFNLLLSRRCCFANE